jgi:hypothetical protein
VPKSEEDEAEAESTDAAAADKGEKGKEKKAGSKDAKESTPSKKAKISPAAAVGPAVAGSNLSENPKPVKVPEQSEEVIAVGRPPRLLLRMEQYTHPRSDACGRPHLTQAPIGAGPRCAKPERRFAFAAEEGNLQRPCKANQAELHHPSLLRDVIPKRARTKRSGRLPAHSRP